MFGLSELNSRVKVSYNQMTLLLPGQVFSHVNTAIVRTNLQCEDVNIKKEESKVERWKNIVVH